MKSSTIFLVFIILTIIDAVNDTRNQMNNLESRVVSLERENKNLRSLIETMRVQE